MPTFDVCLQDDVNGGLLRFNTVTGDYFFCVPGARPVGGGGIVVPQGQADPTQGARAALQNAADRNTTDNSCTCGGKKPNR